MRGFTLIELMVVIVIISILVVLGVPSYTAYNNNQKLTEATSQLQSVLRQAQNNAQTGTQCKVGANTYKALTWGVDLNSNKYTVSALCQEVSGEDVRTFKNSLQEYSLPSGITISNVQFTDPLCTDNDLPVSIDFKNLSSEATFQTSCSPGVNARAEITLGLSNSSNIRTLFVEKGGGIYINSVPLPDAIEAN